MKCRSSRPARRTSPEPRSRRSDRRRPAVPVRNIRRATAPRNCPYHGYPPASRHSHARQDSRASPDRGGACRRGIGRADIPGSPEPHPRPRAATAWPPAAFHRAWRRAGFLSPRPERGNPCGYGRGCATSTLLVVRPYNKAGSSRNCLVPTTLTRPTRPQPDGSQGLANRPAPRSRMRENPGVLKLRRQPPRLPCNSTDGPG